MSKQATRSRPQPARAGSGRGFWIIAVVVVLIGAALVAALVGGRSSGGAGGGKASATLVKQVTSVPANVFRSVGAGTATAAPKPITAPALTLDGKPHVLYMGAEYCPYCATERWAMVVALSRFGTFSNLATTHSSTTDVFPDTQTFSFHGTTYTSRWLAFTGVEMQSNVRSGDGYKTLDVPTAEQRAVFGTYDQAPYIGSNPAANNGIPFIDIGGKYVVSGVTYDPAVLQGKSLDEIAQALHDGTSAIARGAIGAANGLTAAICKITNGQPTSVCSATSG